MLITNRLNRILLYRKPELALIMYSCQIDVCSIHDTNYLIISKFLIKMYRCIVISNFLIKMFLVITHTDRADAHV